jgi:hypothetical protein
LALGYPDGMLPSAVAIGPVELVVVLLLIAYVAALVVTGMKGRWVLFVLGILFGIFAFVGALMPARPGSHWANRKAPPTHA